MLERQKDDMVKGHKRIFNHKYNKTLWGLIATENATNITGGESNWQPLRSEASVFLTNAMFVDFRKNSLLMALARNITCS